MKINQIYEILLSGEEDKALSLFLYYFKNIAKTDDERFSCISGISEIYREKRDYKKSEKYLLVGYKLSKGDNFDMLFNLGVTYFNLGDQEKSDSFINKAKAIKPNDDKLIKFISSLNEKEINYENTYEFEDENGNKKVDIVYRLNILCNQNCTFCNVVNKEYIEPYKDLDTIKKEISDILIMYKSFHKEDVQFILSGGEPTLNKYFWEIVDFLSKKELRILIQTNGVMFQNISFVKGLKKRKGKKIRFYVSFHSHIKSVYNKITRSKDYENAIKGIKNIAKHTDNKLQMNFVFNIYNIGTLKDYVTFLLANFGSDDLDLSLNVSSITGVKDNKDMIKYSEILNELYMVEKKLGKFITISGIEPGGAMCDIPYCVYNSIFKLNLNDEGLFIPESLDIHNTKINNCKKCKYDKNCPGISKAYLLKFGEEEFNFIQK